MLMVGFVTDRSGEQIFHCSVPRRMQSDFPAWVLARGLEESLYGILATAKAAALRSEALNG